MHMHSEVNIIVECEDLNNQGFCRHHNERFLNRTALHQSERKIESILRTPLRYNLCFRNAKSCIFQNENAAFNLVRAWGLEPQRITPREPKGDVTFVKDFL